MATTPNRGYQLPAPGSKLKDDVLRLIAALGAIDTDVADLLTALGGKSDLGHGHAMAEITGLVAALGNKLDVGYHDALANLTDVDVAGVANGMTLLRQASKWIPVALQINNIAGLETALNGKATPADITAAINALVAAAPGALDTLNELATALGNDPDFATTVSVALGNRVRGDAAQAFSAAQKGQARANIGADLLAGFRNKIINGDFNFYQRGVSHGYTTSGFKSADRWAARFAGGSYTVTHSRQAFAAGQADVPGNPKYFHRVAMTAAGTISANVIEQWVEGVQTLAGKLCTLTFYMKASSAFSLDTANCAYIQNFGTGGSPSSQAQTNWNALTVNDTAVTTSWKKFTVLGVIPSIAGKTLGSNNNDGLRVYFALPLTAGLSVDIAHVSLVEGDATSEADPFSPRHAQQELALCQRYFEPLLVGYTGELLSGRAYGTPATFLVEKRTSPSIAQLQSLAASAFPSSIGSASTLNTQSIQYEKVANATGGGRFTDIISLDAEF